MSKHKAPLGVGIIGLGVIAGGYLELSQKDPRLKLAALADASQAAVDQTVAKFPAPLATTDYHALISSDTVDLVVVGTPHFLHHPMVIEALRAGKDVICEKPLAITAAEAEEMIDVARVCGRRLFVGLNMRTNPAFRTVQRAMQSGRLGDVFLARVCYLGHEIERMLDPKNWKGSIDKAGGGVLLDGGYHVIDVMNMLMGKPESVTAVCKRSVITTPNKAEDNAVVLLTYPGNRIGEVTASFTIKNQMSKQEPTLRLRLEAYGTEGSIWTEYCSHNGMGWVTTQVCDDREEQIPVEPFEPDYIARHYIDCLVDGIEPIVSAEDALEVQRIVDQAYRQSGILTESR
jgi:predicted dehydrogenase